MKRSKYQKTKNLNSAIGVLGLGVALVGMAVGYASFSQSLDVSGSISVKAAVWKIEWCPDTGSFTPTNGSATACNKINITSGSTLTGVSVTRTSDTALSFGATMDPGDTLSFTVDAVNSGTIDGVLNSITMSSLTTDQKKYLSYTVSVGGTQYTASATGLSRALAAGGKQTVVVTVAYTLPSSFSDLPSTTQTVNLTLSLGYSDGS